MAMTLLIHLAWIHLSTNPYKYVNRVGKIIRPFFSCFVLDMFKLNFGKHLDILWGGGGGGGVVVIMYFVPTPLQIGSDTP